MGSEVPPAEMATLLVCSVRYALGRMSYVVSEVVDLCKRYGPEIDPVFRGVIRNDIREALHEAERENRTLGMSSDHKVWEDCLKELEAYD